MNRLIEESFLQRLANLRFIVKGRRKGRLSGLHASPRAGVSLEFADYREYVPGDDFRYIDWNVYGRLDRVLVKTYVHEADLPIYLLVDFSSSMQLGRDVTKARYAARLAIAMAYLGLRGLDRVGLFPFTDHLIPAASPRHGMGQLGRILRLLSDTRSGGLTSLNEAIGEFATRTKESGLVILLSDFLSPGGYEEGISRLLYRGDEVVAIQILDPEEVRPSAGGHVRLQDVETNRDLRVTIGPQTLAEYGRRFDEHRNRLQAFLTERGIPYVLATTDIPVERLIHERLRAGGFFDDFLAAVRAIPRQSCHRHLAAAFPSRPRTAARGVGSLPVGESSKRAPIACRAIPPTD